LSFLLKRDGLKKIQDDLSKRIAELRESNRPRDDDGDRTSRIQAVERELNTVLGDYNVCRFFSSFY
jgi:hypothetical protein